MPDGDPQPACGARLEPAVQVAGRVADFAQVVRREVGRHAYRNARPAVAQQVRELARKDRGLAALVVAAGYAAIAGVLALTGKKKVQEAAPAVPEQTVETVKEDVEWAKTQRQSAAR